MKLSKVVSVSAILACLALGAFGQAQAQAPDEQTPSFRATVVDRTTPAVKYEHRSGSTKIDFQGTDLMPSANGEAKVDSHRGAVEIKVEFDGLQKPTTFGNEYLTYILWAVSPEGRAVNIGEVLLGGNSRSKLDVTTDLQTFALIVTAEPYYAVRRPSNVVVMENVVRNDTAGTIEAVDAKYELLDRGGYIPTGYNFDPVVLSAKLPLEFFEARNALRIAKSAGAERYAAPSYGNAMDQMKQADDLAVRKHVENKQLIATSREAVQTAEDAREIAMKYLETASLDRERRGSQAREAGANALADQESQRRISAEADTAVARRQRDEADRQAREAQTDARVSALGQATAEQGRADAEAESDRNRIAANSSDEQLQQALHDREDLRARLLQQFNLILETHDTARGLVVNLSDVLFDTGKFTLRPEAREKLAKVSGIVLAYPALKLAIEGHTDSVGTDDYNQTLSENRAGAVRGYLTSQGIPQSETSSTGFGKTRPIASNDTADGRMQNRRVELVVSGEVIGTEIGIVKIEPIAQLPLTR